MPGRAKAQARRGASPGVGASASAGVGQGLPALRHSAQSAPLQHEATATHRRADARRMLAAIKSMLAHRPATAPLDPLPLVEMQHSHAQAGLCAA